MRIALVGLLLGGCQLAFGIDRVGGGAPDAATDALAPGTGLLARYRMDALALTEFCLVDDTSSGHDGLCSGTTPNVVPGRIGNAFELDSTQVFQVATTGALSQPAAFTFSGWFLLSAPITTSSTCPFNRPYGTTPAGADSWQVCETSVHTSFFYQTTDGQMQSDTDPVVIGIWHHVAIASSGTSISEYLDGHLVQKLAGTMVFDTSPITIGADLFGTSTDAGITGLLDDVRIYDHVVSDDELAQLAQGT